MVTDNAEKSRFELAVPGGVAFSTYRRSPGVVTVIHTEVPEALEGHGIASALVRAGMAYARERGLRVIPFCPFARTYLHRHHADFDDIVDFG